ncbi:MAG: hypothetical protein AVDCRST_MAG88-2526, partial [uncultured Thermomicrobiales bacterium]
ECGRVNRAARTRTRTPSRPRFLTLHAPRSTLHTLARCPVSRRSRDPGAAARRRARRRAARARGPVGLQRPAAGTARRGPPARHEQRRPGSAQRLAARRAHVAGDRPRRRRSLDGRCLGNRPPRGGGPARRRRRHNPHRSGPGAPLLAPGDSDRCPRRRPAAGHRADPRPPLLAALRAGDPGAGPGGGAPRPCRGGARARRWAGADCDPAHPARDGTARHGQVRPDGPVRDPGGGQPGLSRSRRSHLGQLGRYDPPCRRLRADFRWGRLALVAPAAGRGDRRPRDRLRPDRLGAGRGGRRAL